jgi:hypothetical protein
MQEQANLGFFHLSTGIIKSIQHRGVLANKRNLEIGDMSVIQPKLPKAVKTPLRKRLQTRMGVSCPSRSRRPLANAAADICQWIPYNNVSHQ